MERSGLDIQFLCLAGAQRKKIVRTQTGGKKSYLDSFKWDFGACAVGQP